MKAENEKLITQALLLTFFLGVLMGWVGAVVLRLSDPAKETVTTDVATQHEAAHPDPWELFIEALIWVESRGEETAMGQDDDAGVLQIRPCMVAEANRILGMETYTLDDRFSREKSIEMWSVVQDYHNPAHDVIKALKIQNPRASKEYVGEVMRRFYTLMK